MNNQDDNGSLKQVALPADGGSKGGSDSRSETLSPREWPTLTTARDHIEKAREYFAYGCDITAYQEIGKAVKALKKISDPTRRRRPRGESDRAMRPPEL